MLDRLFSPLTINGKTLKNRCVVTPMLMNFCEEDGTCTERFAAYHEAKAKGGFAMIVTENVAVTSVAKGYQWIPGLWKDEHIPGFRDLTDRVHQYDTVIIAQLNHPGISCLPLGISCPFTKLTHDFVSSSAHLSAHVFP